MFEVQAVSATRLRSIAFSALSVLAACVGCSAEAPEESPKDPFALQTLDEPLIAIPPGTRTQNFVIQEGGEPAPGGFAGAAGGAGVPPGEYDGSTGGFGGDPFPGSTGGFAGDPFPGSTGGFA